MATPTLIPVHARRSQYSSELGIMYNCLARTTEAAVLYPQRVPRKEYTFEPPTYHVGDVKHYMIWCPACAEWQRREAFYPNAARSTGLQGICKTCDNAKRSQRRRQSRAA